MSAGHTKEMIDHALNALSQVGDHINIKYSKRKKFEGKIIQYWANNCLPVFVFYQVLSAFTFFFKRVFLLYILMPNKNIIFKL